VKGFGYAAKINRHFVALLIPAFAQNSPRVTITSAADANVGVAPASLTTASGMNLAMQSAAATAVRIVIPANFQSSVADRDYVNAASLIRAFLSRAFLSRAR
jgi:hypothetical protein